jgi:hypothetical protein
MVGVRLGSCPPIMGQPPLDDYIPVLAPAKTALPSRAPFISLGLRRSLVTPRLSPEEPNQLLAPVDDSQPSQGHRGADARALSPAGA